ncbi:MAG: helix-turn-helix transcriptional regulator [Phycisphaerales bacterium]|nr:helix-turn-helix transcriptional regulator [Phycisphaerales bacterium]
MPERDPVLAALGHSVRQARLQRGLTQEALAKRAQFDRTYISLLERGMRNPSLTNLLILARALGVSAGDLVHMVERHSHTQSLDGQ